MSDLFGLKGYPPASTGGVSQGTLDAAIATEATARTNADTALQTEVDGMQGKTDPAAASASTEFIVDQDAKAAIVELQGVANGLRTALLAAGIIV